MFDRRIVRGTIFGHTEGPLWSFGSSDVGHAHAEQELFRNANSTPIPSESKTRKQCVFADWLTLSLVGVSLVVKNKTLSEEVVNRIDKRKGIRYDVQLHQRIDFVRRTVRDHVDWCRRVTVIVIRRRETDRTLRSPPHLAAPRRRQFHAVAPLPAFFFFCRLLMDAVGLLRRGVGSVLA